MGDLFPRPSEMIRRYARQRREYLYRKSLEGKEKELYERKQKLRRALAEGKAIPTELQQDADELSKQIQLDDENTQRINRGGHTIPEIINTCKSKGVSDVIVLHETRGQPDGLIVCHLPFGPTAFFGLSNCVLRHDIEDVGALSLAY